MESIYYLGMQGKIQKTRDIFFEISDTDLETGEGKQIHIKDFKGKIKPTTNGGFW